MRKFLVALVLVLAACGGGRSGEVGRDAGSEAEPIAGHPVGGVTTAEAEMLCGKQYDEIIVPNTPRRHLPLRDVYVDGCVAEMTSGG